MSTQRQRDAAREEAYGSAWHELEGVVLAARKEVLAEAEGPVRDAELAKRVWHKIGHSDWLFFNHAALDYILESHAAWRAARRREKARKQAGGA